MKDGFLRIATAVPEIRVADCRYNVSQIVAAVRTSPADTALIVFPELCITAYTCGDLLLQPVLLQEAERALETLLSETADRDTLLAVGLPVALGASVYNCAAICQKGKLLGLIPKTHLPSYGAYSEARRFASDDGTVRNICFAGQEVPFGAKQVFVCQNMPSFCLGVEICEDLWTVTPPSAALAHAGATVIANLSASEEGVGKAEKRRNLVRSQSARLIAAYAYAGAGAGESTTDLVFAGHGIIAENGHILSESVPYQTGLRFTEVDTERLLYARRKNNVYKNGAPYHTVYFDMPLRPLSLTRSFTTHPFIPDSVHEKETRFEEILTIQSVGLAHRLSHTRSAPVIGLSGGLDSALALLVTLRACDRIGKPRAQIHAVTMPCYGTTARTKSNALALAQAAGCSLYEIDIHASVTQHLQDIGHDGTPDVTYENAQARERTQVLMDLSNRVGGLVVGTGDLSELALGWATYNGDHMSMYAVNASVAKTLVRHLVAYEANRLGGAYAQALEDILDTPVSPELLPPTDGEIAQKTEDLVGPYELHDFFLFHLLHNGYAPHKIQRIALAAFEGCYDEATIAHWLQVFMRRFFTQQFKRSCLPDGPRVGDVSLSPRGDWQMPSDAFSAAWQESL